MPIPHPDIQGRPSREDDANKPKTALPKKEVLESCKPGDQTIKRIAEFVV